MTIKRYETGVALVGGGSGGIGQAVAATLAAAGADVALTYHRNKAGAEAGAEAVRAAGRRAEIAQVDLTDDAACAAFAARMAESFGGIHTAVYAAGPYIAMRHISKLDPALFRETVGTDIFGCFNLLHAALPELRKTRGAIVAVGTPAIERAVPKDIMSAAPKAAIEALIKGIAVEEGRNGIRANCVGVGVIDGGMFHALIEKGDFDERFLDSTKAALALRRIGTPQDIADAVAFLVSDKANYITGQTLMVDGGFAL